MDRRRGRVSRRGLFGFLGRGLEGLKDALDEVSETGRSHEPYEYGDLECIRRGKTEFAEGHGGLTGVWNVHVKGEMPGPGGSLCVIGDTLPDRVIVVHVNEEHWAACSCECPVDGSDVHWSAIADALECPSCDSRWRLDGTPRRGPAHTAQAVYFVDRAEDTLRLTRA